MKKTRSFSKSAFCMLLALLTVCMPMLAGCGKNNGENPFDVLNTDNADNTEQQGEQPWLRTEPPENTEEAADATPEAANTEQAAETEMAEATAVATIDPEMALIPGEDIQPAETRLSLIATIDVSGYKSALYEGSGIIYLAQNDKYGVISMDGKKDTGAKYAKVSGHGRYFDVSTDGSEMDPDKPETLNRTGLIDSSGRILLPEEYAVISLFGKYAVGIKAVDRVYNENDCMIYISSSFFTTFGPTESSPMYSGKWDIYNVNTGRRIGNISGTKYNSFYLYGDLLQYKDDAGEKHYIDINGKEYAGINFFDNGTYIDNSEGLPAVVNYDGKVLFKYDRGEFNVLYYKGSYIACRNVSGSTEYALLNDKGEVVSSYYSRQPRRYGDFIFVNDALYNSDGTKLADCDTIYEDDSTGRTITAKHGREYHVFDMDGRELVCANTEKYGIHTNYNNKFGGVAITYRESGESIDRGYVYATKEFAAGFISIGKWLASIKGSDGKWSLMDYYTGQTLLEGYPTPRNNPTFILFYGDDAADDNIYLYARNGDVTEIYRVD